MLNWLNINKTTKVILDFGYDVCDIIITFMRENACMKVPP